MHESNKQINNIYNKLFPSYIYNNYLYIRDANGHTPLNKLFKDNHEKLNFIIYQFHPCNKYGKITLDNINDAIDDIINLYKDLPERKIDCENLLYMMYALYACIKDNIIYKIHNLNNDIHNSLLYVNFLCAPLGLHISERDKLIASRTDTNNINLYI